MFRDIRRKDRKVQHEDNIKELLKHCNYGYLSLGIAENGYAYGVPMSYVYDEKSSVIYFHCANEGQKTDILKKNNKVSFCILNDIEVLPERFSVKYESVIIFGDTQFVEDNEEKHNALYLFLEKYSPGYLAEGERYIEKSQDRTLIIKIVIMHISAKARS